MFSIDFYQLPNGKVPVEEFLDSLETKMRNKAIDSISLLEEFGNQLTLPHAFRAAGGQGGDWRGRHPSHSTGGMTCGVGLGLSFMGFCLMECGGNGILSPEESDRLRGDELP